MSSIPRHEPQEIVLTANETDSWYSERDISTTLVKGLKVLAAFEAGAAQMTLPEIGSETGYDRATVRRLVITLVDEGLLVKTGKSFSLTPKVLVLAGGYLSGHRIGATVQPILNKYSQEIGREISMATLCEGAAVYLARSNITGSAISFGFTVGSRLPLLHTAVGRMLLALESETAVQAFVDASDLIGYTPQTNLDVLAIHEEIRKASTQGHVIVHSEFEAGVSGMSVPIGRIGTAKTVIGVSGPTATLHDPEILKHCLSMLQICAAELCTTWHEGN